MENEKLIINSDFSLPEYKSELVINANLIVKFAKPAPNAWFRFWTKIMFGWQWRSLTQRAVDEKPASVSLLQKLLAVFRQ